MRLSMSYRNLTQAKRAAIQAEIVALRGGANRAFTHDHSYVQRGSFPSSEIFSDPTMLLGTSGKTTGSQTSLTSHDGVLRVTRTATTSGTAGLLRQTTDPTVTQYAPHVLRVAAHPGRGLFDSLVLRFGTAAGFGSEYASLSGLTFGVLALAHVPIVTSLSASLVHVTATTATPGEFLDVPFYSLSRCALVDNGANLLPYSSDISNVAWTLNNVTITATSVDLPDGTAGTINTIHEDAASPAVAAQHYIEDGVTVSSSTGDYCFSVALKKSNRTWARVGIREDTADTTAAAYFDLANVVVGTITTGSNWSNVRTFIQSLGNDWVLCTVVGQKTNSATGLRARITSADADNSNSYVGLGQNSIFVWRPSLAQSSVPMRLTSTTGTAAASGSSQNLAGGIYTKGWPASTSGLLLPGDQVQIGNQLLIVAASVNSDVHGKAFLVCYPTFQSAPADNAPVIINRPMGKFYLEPEETGFSNAPGQNNFSDAEIVLASAA